MKNQELCKYIVVDSNSSVESEISDKNYFNSVGEAKEWIAIEDPKLEFAWEIYRVEITLEWYQ